MTYTRFTPVPCKPANDSLPTLLVGGLIGLLGFGFLFYELAQAIAWLGSQVVRP